MAGILTALSRISGSEQEATCSPSLTHTLITQSNDAAVAQGCWVPRYGVFRQRGRRNRQRGYAISRSEVEARNNKANSPISPLGNGAIRRWVALLPITPNVHPGSVGDSIINFLFQESHLDGQRQLCDVGMLEMRTNRMDSRFSIRLHLSLTNSIRLRVVVSP